MSQIEIAVSILSALLTGGFIFFFIENNNIEQVVNDKFSSIMNPYHRKLSALMVVTYFLSSRYRYLTKGTTIERLIKEISNYGENIFAYGGDMSYMRHKELSGLNDRISNIWHYFDSSVYDDIEFELKEYNVYSEKDVYKRVEEISPLYAEYKFDKYLLPSIAGDFYIDIWQKVEYVLWEYESWQMKCISNKNKNMFSILLVVLILIVSLLYNHLINPNYLVLSTIICCILFICNLFSFMELSKLRNKIFN